MRREPLGARTEPATDRCRCRARSAPRAQGAGGEPASSPRARGLRRSCPSKGARGGGCTGGRTAGLSSVFLPRKEGRLCPTQLPVSTLILVILLWFCHPPTPPRPPPRKLPELTLTPTVREATGLCTQVHGHAGHMQADAWFVPVTRPESWVHRELVAGPQRPQSLVGSCHYWFGLPCHSVSPGHPVCSVGTRLCH